MTEINSEAESNWQGDASENYEITQKTLMQLLRDGGVKICSPMVRYSKLPFRTLVRQYGCDLAFTPMIVANSFVRSAKARDNEFTTNSGDRPLIVQFAANNAQDFASATELVARFCNGVDLNCGCPQRWAIHEGFGVSLMDKPEVIHDIVRQTKNRLSYNEEDFTISIKIRLQRSLETTVEFCRRVEKAGISWITVHGRTREQRKEPVDLDSIKTLVQSVQCPIVANGDIKSLKDCEQVQQKTGAKGFMAARGLLQNPAMFAGHEVTPTRCIEDWLGITFDLGSPFTPFHHHLIYMCERIMPRLERRVFNVLTGTTAVLDYFKDNYGLQPTKRSTTLHLPHQNAIGIAVQDDEL